MNLSRRISQVSPSATLAITSKAKALRADGEDVVILAAGEPDFDTPDIIKEAAIQAIRAGKTKYTPASGTKELKKSVCDKLLKDNGLVYDPGQIVISNGAKHSLYNALQAICNPGDDVLILSPYWVSYPEMIKLAGACPVTVPARTDNRFKVTVEDIRQQITDRTRAIIINSPSNPAGVVYTRDELERIAGLCAEKDILIISDEIYEKIIYDGREHHSIASVSKDAIGRTIVVNGLSKSHSMTGWRVGYMAAPAEIAGMVSTLQSHSTSNPCSISQAAAVCALTTDMTEDLDRNRSLFEVRRDALMDMVGNIAGIEAIRPEGAFYLFCDISGTGLGSFDFAKRLLDEKKVAVIPGEPFGEDKFIRISYATDMDTLKEGMERIKLWTRRLQG